MKRHGVVFSKYDLFSTRREIQMNGQTLPLSLAEQRTVLSIPRWEIALSLCYEWLADTEHEVVIIIFFGRPPEKVEEN